MEKFTLCHENGSLLLDPPLFNTREEAYDVIKKADANSPTGTCELYILPLDDTKDEDKKIIQKCIDTHAEWCKIDAQEEREVKKMNNKTSKVNSNPNGEAIIRALSEHKGEIFAFAEIADMAGIEAKTGYLTSAKALATSKGMTLKMVKDGAKAQVKTVTEYPSGLKVEAEKEITLNGYCLIDNE